MVVDTDGFEMGLKERSIASSEYRDGTAKIWALDEGRADSRDEEHFFGFAAIRVDGDRSEGLAKRSYRLELRNSDGSDRDERLLGMTIDADWTLRAPRDATLVRTALMNSLSRDLGRWAPRTAPVELFLVDDGRPWSLDHYRGIYILTEHVERHSHRIDVARLGPDSPPHSISGGYILRHEVGGEDPILEYPDEPTDSQRAWIGEWLAGLEETLASDGFDDPRAGYAALIDPDAFVDHLLLVELGRADDSGTGWMFKQRNDRLAMGPAASFDGGLRGEPAGWAVDSGYYPRLLEDSTFRDRVAERWRLHRADVWSDEALDASIDELAAELRSEPLARDAERWSTTTDDGEIEQIRQWLRERARWLDGELAAP